ncbi:NAD(P)/FAD-dependent oxidoreductase [Aeromonas schubertii]|uniref:NAD(P)/FAD-dependent oxidoreductase n=1 Tax=Aeromonas schubertii TaxID=652 RepID=UPI001D0543A2|nr:FAD-dependent oxidoreductase [Aeromonas schubertii]
MPHTLTDTLWAHTLGEPLTPRPPLTRDLDVDIAILGAGYSGLWSALLLKRRDPSLRIALLEAGIAGEGASGRNGGWLMGGFSGDLSYLAMLDGERREQTRRLITGTVARAATELAGLGIACDLEHGGNLRMAARYPEQRLRLEEELATLRQAGFGEEDVRRLEGAQAQDALQLPDGDLALYTPHCARVHPLKLVRGLARAVEAAGISLYEQSPVLRLSPGSVHLKEHTVRAGVIVSALEGYQRLLGLDQGATLPVQSLLLATEPLSESQWQRIGLHRHETFADASRLVTYGQRSADGRLVFGARGGYRFGGQVRTRFPFTPRYLGDAPKGDEFDLRADLLLALFPHLAGVAITHGWGEPWGWHGAFAPTPCSTPASGSPPSAATGEKGWAPACSSPTP